MIRYYQQSEAISTSHRIIRLFGSLFFAVTFAWMSLQTVQAQIDVWLNLDNFDPDDICQGRTPGGTTLQEIVYLPPGDPNIINALEWQFSGPTIFTQNGIEFRPEDERWSFDWGNPLNGDLFIDNYVAFDSRVRPRLPDTPPQPCTNFSTWCYHGAFFGARYFSDPLLDPPVLDWIQVFVASYDKHGVPAGTPIVDPFYNDGTDDAPFYYHDREDPASLYVAATGVAPPGDPDNVFGDVPNAPHLERQAFEVELTLDLYLSSVDPFDPFHVILHDGISWGYEGKCVPRWIFCENWYGWITRLILNIPDPEDPVTNLWVFPDVPVDMNYTPTTTATDWIYEFTTTDGEGVVHDKLGIHWFGPALEMGAEETFEFRTDGASSMSYDCILYDESAAEYLYFDDIPCERIPEPAALALLCIIIGAARLIGPHCGLMIQNRLL